MPEDQLEAFWEAIQADSALKQKLQGITEIAEIAAIAKDYGFNVSEENINKAKEAMPDLLDEDLGGIAGGGKYDGGCAPGGSSACK